MKEAAGEANLTVIAIILIAVVAAVVTPIINSTMTTSAKKACCNSYGGIWSGNTCHSINADGTAGAPISNYWDDGKCQA